MPTLAQIYAKYAGQDCKSGSDKDTVHSYIGVYEELLASYRRPGMKMLEIGIMGGHSLRMWEEYFAGGSVHGVDCCDQPHGGMADLRPMIAEARHNVHLFDATDAAQVEAYFGGGRRALGCALSFDVVVEDASHALEHQLAIYKNLKPFMAPGGIYIIEDVDKIDEVRPLFEAIDPDKSVTILDRRSVKGRFDDVLVVIK